MARERQVQLDCDEPFAPAAARVIGVRAAEVFGHAHGVLDPERPERLHDMRVATRRLRAAMEVFEPCFPRRRFRRALREVKALADALGARRDRDVEIEFLERFAPEADAADAEALGELLARLGEERRRANEELAPFLGRARLRKLRRRLRRLGEELAP